MREEWAVVTGGARNIGAAIARRLLADGFRVIVLDILEPQDEALRPHFHRIDLSDAEATAALMEEIAATHHVTCLVNNVGIVLPVRLEEVDPADFDPLMHVNVRASIVCTQAVLAPMRRLGGGRIVLVTSRVVKGKAARTLYAASKGAAEAMARTWALELAADNITVNCVAPGPIATSAFWENNPPDAPVTRAIVETIPVGRMGTPEDVAHAVSFLCDARSGFVTGQTLFVCGGVTVG
jgi:NAD(P)-dependent dehydrogenase (short-subunit alcohol dehydrogenase family)